MHESGRRRRRKMKKVERVFELSKRREEKRKEENFGEEKISLGLTR